ncbi:hypothetical protein Hte_006384 [Hypoxylon texense]
MEFAYSLSMYSPPVRVRPANTRKSSSNTNANANANTSTYTFVHGANKQNTTHPPHRDGDIGGEGEEQEQEQDNTTPHTTTITNNSTTNSNSNSNNITNLSNDEEEDHRRLIKKSKKQKSSDTASVRSRIPGRRRPPPAGTIPQLAHRPASHRSHSRTSSSFSLSSRASHETQSQAQAQAQPPVPAQQFNLASTPSTFYSTPHSAHAAAGDTPYTNYTSSPPTTSSRSNDGRDASAITVSSPPIDGGSGIHADTNANTNTSTQIPNTRRHSTVASASVPAPAPALAPPVPVVPASIASTSPPLHASDSERQQSASPKSSKFIRSVHIPIFSTDSGYHYQHTTSNYPPAQKRLYKRDSLHQSNQVSNHPPTPTSPTHTQTFAGPSSPVRRRSSRGKHHHDAMPIEPCQFSPSQKYTPAFARVDNTATSGPTHASRTAVMASSENLNPSSAEGSISASSASGSTKMSIASKPFITRNNRTYINEPTLLYPLPVDLAELHRQSLRTLMLFQLFGGPTTAPGFSNKPPSRVLEVGCGSAFWSMMCHRYFAQHGYSQISFTGLDIVPLVGSGLDQNWKPDKEMRWRFVQHDMRRTPWPLADNEFDLIMIKDMSLCNSMRDPQQFFEEYLRILKPGGVIEFWESDHTIRMLRPHVLKTPAVVKADSDSDSDDSSEGEDESERLGAYAMTNNTPLSAPLNPFLVEYNGWATKGLDARGLSAVPCTLIGPHLLQEAEILTDVRSKRLAVPLSEIRWEREGVGGVVTKDGKSYIDSMKGKGKTTDAKGEKSRGKALTAAQAALRRTALETVVGMIQCLEPILREISGKSQDEWDNWNGKMMNDLLRDGGTSWGECLEVGAWCARKKLNLTS